MIIDTSAIIAVLLDEANAVGIAQAIESGSPRLLSAANLLEASMVIESRKGEAGGRELDFAALPRRHRGCCGESRPSRDRPGSRGDNLGKVDIRPG
jgi:PIN domain